MKKHPKIQGALPLISELILPRKQDMKYILINIGITMMTLAAAFALSTVLISLGDSNVTVPLVFAVAVLMTAWRTEGYFYSLIATLVSVFGINLCFTYPYMEFNFTLTGYPVTFLAMFMITMVVGMLTDQVKRQSRIRHEAERGLPFFCPESWGSCPFTSCRSGCIIVFIFTLRCGLPAARS